MLFFVFAIAFLAAANAAHVTTIQEVNGLIDKTIHEIQAHKRIDVPGLNGLAITGLEQLKRTGNCVKTAAVGAFQCKATAEEAVFTAQGEKGIAALHITFAVVTDTEGRLVNFKLEDVQIVPKDEVYYGGFFSKIGKALGKAAKEVVKIAEVALHAVVEQKVTGIVTEVATMIVG